MHDFLSHLFNKLGLGGNFARNKRNAPPLTDDSFIDVKDLIANLTDQQLITSANSYWDTIGIDSEQCYKPFQNAEIGARVLADLSTLFHNADFFSGARVLDFGCGNGWLTLVFAEIEMDAHGIDIAEKAIKLAEQFRDRRGLRRGSRSTFKIYDGQKIPYPDNHFDRIVCFDSFHHVRDAKETLAELNRVLIPGGQIVMNEPEYGHSKKAMSQYEMRNYNVIENDIDLWELATTSISLGLEPPVFDLEHPTRVKLQFNGDKFWEDETLTYKKFTEAINQQRANSSHYGFIGKKITIKKPSASRKIEFNNGNKNVNELIKKGFSAPESWGIWSDGPISEIEIPLETSEVHGVNLNFKMRAFITDGKDKFTAKMKIYGHEISKIEISNPLDFPWNVSVDGKYLADQKSLNVTFEFDDLKSPFELGLSEDRRLISIGLLDLHLVRALTAEELQNNREKTLDTATLTYTNKHKEFSPPEPF